MPATTPAIVPMTRSRPRVSTSPRLEVPANTTNAAITAQYHRDGDNSSPPMMARLVATPTWMACRVVSASPGEAASSSGSVSSAAVSAGGVSSAGAVGWCLRPSSSASASRVTAKATRCPSSPSPSTWSTSGATLRCAAASSAGTRAGAVPVAVAAPSERRAASSGQRSASDGLPDVTTR
jgi:hypothetical protein